MDEILAAKSHPMAACMNANGRSRFLLISKHANTYQSIYIRVRI